MDEETLKEHDRLMKEEERKRKKEVKEELNKQAKEYKESQKAERKSYEEIIKGQEKQKKKLEKEMDQQERQKKRDEDYKSRIGTFVVKVKYEEGDGLIGPVNEIGHFEFLPYKGFVLDNRIDAEFGYKPYEEFLNNEKD